MTRTIRTEAEMLKVKGISWVDNMLILTIESDHGDVVYELSNIDNIKSKIEMTYSVEEHTTSAMGAIHFEAKNVKRVKG